MRCREVVERATDYAESAIDPWHGFLVRRHLAACDDCRTFFAQLALTSRAARTLSTQAISSEQMAGAMQALAAFKPESVEAAASAANDVYAAARRRASFVPAIVGTALGGVLSVAFAHARSPIDAANSGKWLIAGAGLVIACALAQLSRARGGLAAMLALGTAVAGGVLTFESTEVITNMACALHELGTAAVAFGALAVWRRGSNVDGAMAAGVAAAGALAGDAALHLTCPGASSLGHVLVFHVGGVVAAAAIAGTFAARMLDSTGRQAGALR